MGDVETTTNDTAVRAAATQSVTLDDLLELLDLERLDPVRPDPVRLDPVRPGQAAEPGDDVAVTSGAQHWRGQPQAHPDDRTFGGLLLAQGLVAAGRTAATDQRVVSLQADFIGGVPADQPMHWRVDMVSDARSLSTRRSTLLADDGSELFTATTRWATTREDLPSWSSQEPAQVPGPETLQDLADRHRDDPRIPAWWRIERPVHFRHVEPPPYLAPESVTDRQTVHLRATSDLPDDPVIRAAVAAYVTDMSLLEPAYRALGASRHKPGSRILSLTHGITFHREPDLSTWHQFDTHVGIVAHGRALGDGDLFDSSGRHVLSTTQLGLVKTV